MKNTLLLLVLLFLTFSCSDDSGNAGPSTDPVPSTYLESFTSYMTPFEFGKANSSLKFTWESESYDINGNVLQREYRANFDLDKNSNSLWKDVNKYTNNVLTEKTEYKSGVRRNTYTYSNSLLTQMDVFSGSGLAEKYLYEYAGGNKPSKMKYWWMFFDDTPTIHEYTYDGAGNLVKDRTIFATLPEATTTYEYDNKNNLLKKSYYSSDNGTTSILYFAQYTYDPQSRISEKIFSANPFYYQKYAYHYNDKNTIESIDVFASISGAMGPFEQKGIINYEYNYKDK